MQSSFRCTSTALLTTAILNAVTEARFLDRTTNKEITICIHIPLHTSSVQQKPYIACRRSFIIACPTQQRFPVLQRVHRFLTLIARRQLLRFKSYCSNLATAKITQDDIARARAFQPHFCLDTDDLDEEQWPPSWIKKPRSLPSFLAHFREAVPPVPATPRPSPLSASVSQQSTNRPRPDIIRSSPERQSRSRDQGLRQTFSRDQPPSHDQTFDRTTNKEITVCTHIPLHRLPAAWKFRPPSNDC